MADKDEVHKSTEATDAQAEKGVTESGLKEPVKKDEKVDEPEYISLVQLVKEKSKEEQIIKQLSKNSKSIDLNI